MDSSVLLSCVAAGIGFFALHKKLRFHRENRDKDSSFSSSSSSPPPSPTSSPHRWTYDVFPSFRGEDVRSNLLAHIRKEFERKVITLFNDNGIKRGEFITPELEKAIRESKIAVILISENYASSSWCLDELVEIMKCREEFGQIVLAVFYKVDPSDVKKQRGKFGEIFRKTCKGRTKKVTQKWRQALANVATVAGYHSNNWDNEAKMIEDIANGISNMLNNSSPSSEFDSLVGMETHIENMEAFLCLDLNEVRVIGIWGPAGIGKSTISRCVFDKHYHQFQLSTIMVNIRESYPPCLDEYNAKLRLENQLMSQLMNQKDINISHLGVAKHRLKDKKVLVVLDDVDRVAQVDALAQNTSWFGPGSRIIITTENLRVLKAYGINHIYKVDFPPDHEALQIFCLNAFGQKSPKDGFEELAWEVTKLTGNLPLGLEVMGSHFRGMTKQEWTNALPRLRTRLDGNIHSIFQFSYDALDDEDKFLFLYIACFFNYERLDQVEALLETNILDVKEGLKILAEKSLISISDYGGIEMHKLLVIFGRDIVRKQSVCDPGHRQFLVDAREIRDILVADAAGSRSIVGIDFNYNGIYNEVNISERAFKGMSNLQFLRFDHKMLNTSRGLNYLSQKLRLLNWAYFPMTCLPSIVNTENLVMVQMCNSKLEKLWEGTRPLGNLMWMYLCGSLNLKELPFSIGDAINLKELNLRGCSSLVELPSSIGNITSLKYLILHNCSSLVKLPSSIGNITSLQILDLSECSSLVELPSSIGNITYLQELNLRGCSNLVELPSSIGNITSLQKLNLGGCSSLVELPYSIGNLNVLYDLFVDGCSSLVELPSSIGNLTCLQKLNLSECSSLIELPSTIGNISYLHTLNLSKCSSLVEIPSSIGNITSLRKLNLIECLNLVELPSSIGNITSLQELDLRGCSNLVEMPSSIGNLTCLQKLDFSGCSSLVDLSSSIGNITSLKYLYLFRCSSLVELPSSIGNIISLQELDLSRCSNLVEIPSSIGNITSLQELDLSGCSSLVDLFSSIGNITSLQKLDLRGCSSLVDLPSSIGNLINLQILDIIRCSSLVELPSSIGNITSLQELDLSGCSSLVEIPSSIGNITSLEYLNLSGCSSLIELPSTIGNIINLQNLNLSKCSSLMELHSSIGNITTLKKLNLSECLSLVEIPSSIGNITSLQELNLSGCSNLVELPPSIRNIHGLKLITSWMFKLGGSSFLDR